MLRYVAGAAAVAVALSMAGGASATDGKPGAQVAQGPVHSFHIRAIINDGAPEIPDNVSYVLEKTGAGGEPEVVASATGGAARMSVPPGLYRLTTSYGSTKRYEIVEVRGDIVGHTVNLNAGEITLAVSPAPGRPVVTEPIAWRILSYGTDSEGKRHLMHASEAAQPMVVLPAGWYMVEADHNGTVTTHVIEVGAGQRYDYTLVKKK